MTGNEGADNCQKFVDILGLRSIFPLFMKTPKKHKKVGTNSDEMEGMQFVFKISTPVHILPVHIYARYAHMHHFPSICLSIDQTILTMI